MKVKQNTEKQPQTVLGLFQRIFNMRINMRGTHCGMHGLEDITD